ncbi:MAG: hypothetical protein E7655_00920 [Ruminococcaceae bacterium]|nr:hypothetical protein [Oscillospiraceae bacterium]
MKKKVVVLLILSLVLLHSLLLSSCGGKVPLTLSVSIVGECEQYSVSEIHSAAMAVKSHFRKHFNGCEMLSLSYHEEKSLEDQTEWAERYGVKEAIVLYSDFRVDSSGGDGSLNPDSTYRNWSWVLVKSFGGWTLKDWGYA